MLTPKSLTQIPSLAANAAALQSSFPAASYGGSLACTTDSKLFWSNGTTWIDLTAPKAVSANITPTAGIKIHTAIPAPGSGTTSDGSYTVQIRQTTTGAAPAHRIYEVTFRVLNGLQSGTPVGSIYGTASTAVHVSVEGGVICVTIAQTSGSYRVSAALVNNSNGGAYETGWSLSDAATVSGTSVTRTNQFHTVNMSGVLTSTLADGTAPFQPTSTTVCPNLNADLLDGQHGAYYAPAADLSAHISDTTEAHQASAIGVDDTYWGPASADTVEEVTQYLNSSMVSVATDLSNHLSDATDAHDASAISYDNTSSGLTADDVQSAIDELATMIASSSGGLLLPPGPAGGIPAQPVVTPAPVPAAWMP